ncbi:hypothetical protein [Lacrimispora celerecrescens]|uniref:Uncharacterized protein n=1 Tax=[Clostridium] celerecrescens 18A TaxID=1286362 RepID=A0A2M8Z7Y0_9FIRM|nr:hypothetical protein [Lacrimispora celerecrescens]PJJ29546.1 hypothetical protein H171_3090 [[Clostridium] celerecrescens 18A]
MKDLIEKWKNVSKEEIRRLLKFLFFPLAAVILIFAVIVLDKPEQTGNNSANASTEAVDPGEAEGTPSEAAKEITLQEEAIPAIHDLMEAYFKARKTCDIEALSKVFGNTGSLEAIREQGARMEEEVKFYQSFENLVCYTATGLEEGDYVVYARFDIKFRQAETLAPSLVVCYVKTAADGSYYLVADTSAEQSEFMEKANQSEAVQKQAKEVNGGLENALKSDENLLAVYHILMDEKEEPEDTTDSVSQPNNT